jgi:hypothetical protein
MPETLPLQSASTGGRSPPERRAAPRFHYDQETPVWPLAAGSQSVYWAGAVNFSRTGVGLLLHDAVEPGTPVAVELRGRAPQAPYIFLGRVVHRTPRPHGHSYLGCAWDRSLSEAEVEALRRDP